MAIGEGYVIEAEYRHGDLSVRVGSLVNCNSFWGLSQKCASLVEYESSCQIYASQYFDSVLYPSLTGTKTVLEFLAKDYPKAKTADPASFIDSSLVKELDT